MLAIVVAVMLLLAMTGRSLSFHAGGVAVGQCQAPQHTRPVTTQAFEPVWRTFTDARDGFSLSLPATWDGVVVGDQTPTRSPWLGDSLHRMLAASDSSVKFVAAGRPGAPDLSVMTRPALPGASVDCRLTLSSDVSGKVGIPSNVRGARIHLLAGDANEATFTDTESVGGRMVDYVRLPLRAPARVTAELARAPLLGTSGQGQPGRAGVLADRGKPPAPAVGGPAWRRSVSGHDSDAPGHPVARWWDLPDARRSAVLPF